MTTENTKNVISSSTTRETDGSERIAAEEKKQDVADESTEAEDVVDLTAEDNDENGNGDDWRDADFLSFDVASEKNDADADNNADNDNGDSKSKNESVNVNSRFIPHISKHTMRLPPWMKVFHRQHSPKLVCLHNEILGFAQLMMPRDFEIKERENLIEKLRKVAEASFGGPDKCKVEVFGSQATNLFLPESDIDIAIQLTKDDAEEEENPSEESVKEKEKREMEEWHIPSGSPLYTLAEALRESWKEDLTYLEVVDNTRVPIVKFTHGPTNISIDVCFNQAGGPETAKIMNTYLSNYPPLRPLCFVLKHFLKVRGINEPYSGGIGSFLLQMMLVSFLQHRAREENFQINRSLSFNLGGLLLEFLELYGLDFNYVTTGISVRNDGSYFPKGAKEKREVFWHSLRPFSLALENPHDPASDVGRSSFRMIRAQRSFEVAFRVLLSHVTDPPLAAVSILSAVLPWDEELVRRSVLTSGDCGTRRRQPSEAGSDMATSEDDDGCAYRYGRGEGETGVG